MISEPIIDRRDDFPKLIDQLGLKVGLEVGVCKGEYSKLLLGESRLDLLCGVDAYSNDEVLTRTKLKKCDRAPGKFEQHYEEAKITLERFGSRHKLIRKLSEEAVDDFADDSLDFIYLDASHLATGVFLDLMLYYPKLKVGGIMAIHDVWLKYRNGCTYATCAFAVEKEQLLNFTGKEREFPVYPPTAWFIKRAWSKGDYFEALYRHLPRLEATRDRLKQHRVTIFLPYEYEIEIQRLKPEASYQEAYNQEIQRLNAKL